MSIANLLLGGATYAAAKGVNNFISNPNSQIPGSSFLNTVAANTTADVVNKYLDKYNEGRPSFDDFKSAIQGLYTQEQLNTAEVNAFNKEQARLNRLFQANSAQRAMDFEAEQAEINRRWQKEMSDTSYQRVVQDLKKAGLNPILAVQRGGASTPSGTSASGFSSSGSTASGQKADFSKLVQSALSYSASMTSASAQFVSALASIVPF